MPGKVATTTKVRIQQLKTVSTEVVVPDALDIEPYPNPRNPDLPKMFWLGAMCGSRGSGKTMACIRLLKNYEECGIATSEGKPVDQRIVLFSPTFDANPSFKRLKHLDKKDIHRNYTEKALFDVVDGIQKDRAATRRYKQACFLWKQFVLLTSRDIDPMLKMRREDLQLLSSETNGFREPPVAPPHPLGQACFLVLDDCLSTSAFSLNRLNKFCGFAMNSRHSWTCVLILSQRAKQIPPAIRTNLSLLMHWKLMSNKVLLEEIYPLVSNLVSEPDFLALFEVATSKLHDSFTVDMTADAGRQFKRNLSEIMTLA